MARRQKPRFSALAVLIPLAFALVNDAAPLEDQLVTRNYKLDSVKIQKLSETATADLAPPPKNSPSNLLRALFAQEGISFPTNVITTNIASLKNQKGFYYNETSGELQLRATRRDIPKFEKHLAKLSPEPHTATESIQTTFTSAGAWIEIKPDDIPPAHLLTLNPTPIFTTLNSLDDFTNLPALTAKAYPTVLPASNRVVSVTVTQPTTIHYIRVHSPVIVDLLPTIQQVAMPSVGFKPGTLIIRADSDLR